MDEHGWYRIGYRVWFVLVFLGCWIYGIASYGFLFRLGLGWLPSGIMAAAVSFLWPFFVVALVILVWVLIYLFLFQHKAPLQARWHQGGD